MSNVGIGAETPVNALTATRARLLLGAMLTSLVALSTQVPGPAIIVSTLTSGWNGSAVGTVSAQLEEALMLVAGLALWLILGWLAVCLSAATLAALSPTILGPLAGRMLARFSPRTARQFLLTAVGAGAIAGLTACAPAPTAIGSGADGYVEPAITASVTTTGANAAPAQGWDFDWPATDSTTQATTSAGAAGASETAGTSIAGPALPSATETTNPPTTSAPTTSSASTSSASTSSAPTSTAPTETATTSTTPTNTTPTTAPAASPSVDAQTPSTAQAPMTPPAQASVTTPELDVDWPITAPATAAQDAVPTSTPAVPEEPTPPQPSGETAAPAAAVVVRPGDSLWSIAAAHLAPDATGTEIDTAWRAWYLANETKVGPDPNVIQVGVELDAPPS